MAGKDNTLQELASVDAKQEELVVQVHHVEFFIPQEFQDCFYYSFMLQILKLDVKLCCFVYVLFIILNFYKTRGRVFMNKGFVIVSCVHGFFSNESTCNDSRTNHFSRRGE